MDREIILASQSPRRKELMEKITQNITVLPSHVEETVPSGLSVAQTAEYLSKIKAMEIARQYPQTMVLGADTIVVLGEEIMGKPRDKEDCRRMIAALSGKTHQVYTGVTLIKDEKARCFHCKTDVTFFPLTAEEVESYISSDEPYDKAGGYGIQGQASVFVEKIVGDYFNIMGLPVAMVYRALRDWE